jgi:hypothetical protein
MRAYSEGVNDAIAIGHKIGAKTFRKIALSCTYANGTGISFIFVALL